MLWHSETAERTADELKSDVARGLSDSAARKLLEKHGENKLEGKKETFCCCF